MRNVCREEGIQTPQRGQCSACFGEGVPPDRRRWYCRVGRRYVPIGFNTNLAQFGHNLRSKFWGKGTVVGLTMGSLSKSPVVTSYRLPIGLSLTVFAVLRLVTDGQTDGIGLAKGSNFIGHQTVELCT